MQSGWRACGRGSVWTAYAAYDVAVLLAARYSGVGSGQVHVVRRCSEARGRAFHVMLFKATITSCVDALCRCVAKLRWREPGRTDCSSVSASQRLVRGPIRVIRFWWLKGIVPNFTAPSGREVPKMMPGNC